jgi:hypothetical protein
MVKIDFKPKSALPHIDFFHLHFAFQFRTMRPPAMGPRPQVGLLNSFTTYPGAGARPLLSSSDFRADDDERMPVVGASRNLEFPPLISGMLMSVMIRSDCGGERLSA